MKKIKSLLKAAFSNSLPASGAVEESIAQIPPAGTLRENAPGHSGEGTEIITAEASPSRDAEWAWC